MEDEALLLQPRHVFVDASGRRAALLRRGSWAVSVVLLLAFFALVLALVAPPRLTRLVIPGFGGLLPGAAAPRLDVEGGEGAAPRDVLAPLSDPSAGATPVETSGPVGTVSPGGTPGSEAASPRPTPPPATGAPTAAPTPGAGPSPTTGSRPPTPPGQATASAAPSGPARPTARPTPGGGRPTATSRP